MLKQIFSFLSILSTKGQPFTKEYFVNTHWFTENTDSIFYKSDTIKLKRFSHRVEGLGSIKFAEDDVHYLQTNKIIRIDLLSKYKMNLEELNVDNWQVATKKGTWTWQFDKPAEAIQIYFNKKLLFHLKPIIEKEVIVRSKFADDENYLTTVELTLIKQNP